MTPGLNGSIKTSALAISFLNTSLPLGIFGLIATERFPRQSMSAEEEEGLFTRMTVAPLSASLCARQIEISIVRKSESHWAFT